MNKLIALIFSVLVGMLCGMTVVFAQQKTVEKNIDDLTRKFYSPSTNKEKAAVLELITDYYYSKGNTDSLIRYGKLAIDVYRAMNNSEYVARNELIISKAFLDKGDIP